MRGYTPWRVEEVGKLHHDVQVRIMTDSMVRTDDILLEVLDILTDHDTQEHFDQGAEYDTDSQTNGLRRLSYRAFDPLWRTFTVNAMTFV